MSRQLYVCEDFLGITSSLQAQCEWLKVMVMVKHNYEIFVDNMRLCYMLYNNVAFIANVVIS